MTNRSLGRQRATNCISKEPKGKRKETVPESANANKKRKAGDGAGGSAQGSASSSGCTAILNAIKDSEPFSVTVKTTTGERQATFVDELIRSCYTPLAGLTKGSINFAQVDSNVAAGLKMLFHGGICKHLGIEYTSWPTLSAELLKVTVQGHIAQLSDLHWHLTEDDASSVSQQKLLDMFMPKKCSDAAAAPGRTVSVLEMDLKYFETYTQNKSVQHAWVSSLVSAVHRYFSDGADIRRTDAIFSMMPQLGCALFKKQGAEKVKLSLLDFLICVQSFVQNIIPESWATYAAACVSVHDLLATIGESGDETLQQKHGPKDFEDISLGIFLTKAIAENAMTATAVVLCEVLKQFAAGVICSSIAVPVSSSLVIGRDQNSNGKKPIALC